jgi:uncharacterized phage protein (TIGR02218 family)
MLPLTPSIVQHVKWSGTKRYTRCLRVTRRDGEVYRWTDHDAPVALRTSDSPLVVETFDPSTSPSSESRRESSSLDANVTSLFGFMDSGSFTAEDLRIGLWRLAKFELFVCDWRFGFAGWMEKRVYYVQDIKWTGSLVEIELAGVTKLLDVRIGRIYGRECDANVYDDRCGVNPTGFTSGTRTVTDVAGVTDPHPRLRFESNNTLQSDDFWKGGLLAWLSGNNAITGFNEYVVKLSKQTGGEMELWVKTPYDIEVGDTFVVLAGCQKRLIEDCKNKFSNQENHRGFAQMVNPDVVLKTPGAKK